jgi:hypothetical protein
LLGRYAFVWHAFPNRLPEGVKLWRHFDVLPTVGADDMIENVAKVALGMFSFSWGHGEDEFLRPVDPVERFGIAAVSRLLAPMLNHRVRDHEAEPEGFLICRNFTTSRQIDGGPDATGPFEVLLIPFATDIC